MNPCDTPLSPFAEVIKGYKIFFWGGISCAVCASCCLTLTVTKACGGAPAIICKGSAVSHSTIFSLFSQGCSRFTARCGSRLCFCLLFLPLPARRHDGKQKQCRPDEAKGSPTGRAEGRPASNARPCRRSPPFVVLTSLPRFNRPHSDSISSNRCVELFY